MCKSIEEAEIFKRKEINLNRCARLSVTDLECLSLFLATSSLKQWKSLDLISGDIQDCGLQIIHKYLIGSNVIITELGLRHNGLTKSSSSLVRDIILSCKVEKLILNDNDTIGENGELYTMLTHPSNDTIHEPYLVILQSSSNTIHCNKGQ